MVSKKPWLNDSGCPDPTAYEAIKNIQMEEKRSRLVDDDAHKIVTTIKNILDLSEIGRASCRDRV